MRERDERKMKEISKMKEMREMREARKRCGRRDEITMKEMIMTVERDLEENPERDKRNKVFASICHRLNHQWRLPLEGHCGKE